MVIIKIMDFKKGDIVYLNEKHINHYYKNKMATPYFRFFNIPLKFHEFRINKQKNKQAYLICNNGMIIMYVKCILSEIDYKKLIRLEKLKTLK